MRDKFLPFALPDTNEAEVSAVSEVIRSGWLTTGTQVRAFEAAFAKYVGARHAIAVNSCTAAMHLALEALGVKAGDKVITTPYTFAATAEVIRYMGAHPLFVDVRPDTLNIDIDQVSAVLKREHVAAIMPVHIAGEPCDVEALDKVAGGIPIIEDAAHALPTKLRGRNIGSLSRFTCFSFYATKTLSTGEGGMITTDDDAAADRCRIMSLHGISRDAWKRYTAEGSWAYEIIAPGYIYNVTDVAAALGLVQLGKLVSMWKRRVEIAGRFDTAFAARPELQIPARAAGNQHAWHLYMLRVDNERIRGGRDAFAEAMRKRNIGISVHFIPLHIHPYYRDTYGYKPEDFPVAHREYSREISLPIYSRMSDRDVDDVIAAVLETATDLAPP
ncbi:MAG: UDP-4-amino-4-deoxy-L-arabinose--oxoglutarate aminotransferase [Myxococcales bacterium]|nr:UDP-4-amino-4-deoxy-L-arabinose--oxoglutarate aminotransferase [Myxococcales bacterium]